MLLKKIFTGLAVVILLITACVPANTPTATTILPTTTTGSPTNVLPTQGASPSQAATPEGTWIQVTPQSATPGSAVTIDGFLPGGPDQAQANGNEALQHANVCWQGCQSGIVLQGQPVNWSSAEAGRFQITFTVPATAWIQDDSVQPLISGDYLVGIQCLIAKESAVQGCALTEAQASTTLRLNVATASGQAKTTPSLVFSPASANPGSEIKVTGWAPLDEIIGTIAFGYSLVLVPSPGASPIPVGDIQQGLDGNLSGSFVVPQSIPGSGVLQPGQYTLGLQAARPQNVKNAPPMLAETTFEITQGIAWSTLQLGQPDWIDFSGSISEAQLSTEPGHPGWLAYCSNDQIRATRDGGKTWNTIPISGVEKAAQPTYSVDVAFGNQPCFTVVMDPNQTGSYYATFRGSNISMGAPPVFFLGFYTQDSGKTWMAVPPPTGSSPEKFGGFATDGQVVEGLFWQDPTSDGQPTTPVEERTTDGGHTWREGTPLCLHSIGDACLRWGPSPDQIGGMGSPAPQYVAISPDKGQTWSFPRPSVELRMQGPHQLVGFVNPTPAALLISGSADFPVQISKDNGATWTAISIPALPNSQTPGQFSQLQLLPGGQLLAKDDNSQWMLLEAGANQWCSAAGITDAADTIQFVGSGDQLWWLKNISSAPQIGSTALTAVRCK